jgi:hypothetical protein
MRRAQDAEKACPAKRFNRAKAGSGGRFKCVSGRQSVRTRRRVGESGNSWGHAADRKVHPRAERRRLPVSRGDPDGRLKGLQDRVTRKGTHALCSGGGRHGCCSAVRGPAGAGKRQAFRTPLVEGRRKRTTDVSRSRHKHGAMTRVLSDPRYPSRLAKASEATPFFERLWRAPQDDGIGDLLCGNH